MVRWVTVATRRPKALNSWSDGTPATARLGTPAAASRLIGYQMLWYLKNPHAQARTAIAKAPANPPFTPER